MYLCPLYEVVGKRRRARRVKSHVNPGYAHVLRTGIRARPLALALIGRHSRSMASVSELRPPDLCRRTVATLVRELFPFEKVFNKISRVRSTYQCVALDLTCWSLLACIF